MPTLLYSNNAAGTLAAPMTNSQTTLTLNPGAAALFPNPVAGQAFYATITDAATQTLIEIVLVTSVAGNVFTITRGQDGTTGLSWNSGDIVSQRAIAAEFRSFQQGHLVSVQTFTSSGTYTPTDTARVAIVQAIGGGGAGGSITFTVGGAAAVASGGSSGAYGECYVATGLTTTAVSVGLGGAAGAQGNNPGGAGGSTSFGALMICSGGQGGLGGTGSSPPFINPPNPLVNGVSFGAVTQLVSGRTSVGSPGIGASTTSSIGGSGSNSFWGSGGIGGGGGNGAAGSGSGAGGGGAGQGGGSGSGFQGGVGAPGLLIVYEFS